MGKINPDDYPDLPQENVQLKRCYECDRTLPLNADNFHKNSSTSTGYHQSCKVCRSKRKRSSKKDIPIPDAKELDKELERLDQKSLSLLCGIPDVVDPSTLPHVATMLEHIMELFGGSEGYSHHLMGQYLSSKPGSFVRQKTLEMIMRLVVKVSESGAAKVPLEHLDDADLERVIQEKLKRLRFVESEDTDEG